MHEGVNVNTRERYAVKVVRKTRSLQTGGRKDPVQKEVDIFQSLNHVGLFIHDSVSATYTEI